MNVSDLTGVFASLSKVTDRLDTLERENRRLKWVSASLFVLAMVAVAEGSTWVKKTQRLVVEELAIRDKAGNIRATLGLNRSGAPELALLDMEGVPLARLEGVNGNAAALTLSGNGDELVHLTSGQDRSSGLRFSDRVHNSHAAIYLNGDGTSGMVLSHEVMGVQVGVQPEGISGIAVTDADGRERGRLGNIPEDVSAAGLTHPNGRPPFRIVQPEEQRPPRRRVGSSDPVTPAEVCVSSDAPPQPKARESERSQGERSSRGMNN